MKYLSLLFLLVTLPMGATQVNAQDNEETSCGPLLDFNVKRLNSSETVHLCEAYAGKVLLVVNTASKCLFTDQYNDLEKLYEEYRGRGLVVLGFPSNDFANQEPGSEQQIRDFCRLTYGVKFPMFAKISVKKGKADPFYQSLAEAAGSYPKWNFHKYLIGRDGQLIDYYYSWTSPNGKSLRKAIDAALKQEPK